MLENCFKRIWMEGYAASLLKLSNRLENDFYKAKLSVCEQHILLGMVS